MERKLDQIEQHYKHRCPHVFFIKRSPVRKQHFATLHQFIHFMKLGLINTKVCPVPNCFTCGTLSGRLHVCTECVFVGCGSKKHIIQHLANTLHPFAVDTVTGGLYCRECGDYVYDFELTLIGAQQRQHVATYAKQNYSHLFNDSRPLISDEDAVLVRFGADPTADCVPQHLIGLRGLNNLGNTCFMSVILQSFVHNPVLRSYFLNDMHNRSRCIVSQQGKICLGCEVDALFTAMFAGLKQPFSPHHFLYTTWRNSDYLAGYEQQDAHEFFIASLDGIHSHHEERIKIMEAQRNGGSFGNTKLPNNHCTCVVHQVFQGRLRSDVYCHHCSQRSTAYDPFFDISLDISNVEASAGPDYAPTLVDCLRKYTQPEVLEKFECNRCHSTVGSTKQLSIHTLPLVICFHLKRFQQTTRRNAATVKVEKYINFPLYLDMRPFLSTSIIPLTPQEAAQLPDYSSSGSTRYELFCVVNHHGKIDNGHYTCFVRHSGAWYLCDDHRITRTTAEDVLYSMG